jgi:hypothetical protein
MRLPVKFLPKQSQHLGNVVGAVIVIMMGLAFMSSYLPDRTAAENMNMSFGEWLGLSGVRIPFLLVTIIVLLFGLVALTVALINLLGGSPFNYVIVDRFGIQNRTFFGETRFSWKDLGPIRPLRRSVLQAMGLDRRFWIVSDTFSGEGRMDGRRALSSFNLKIPVASYLGSTWLGGNIGPAMEATAVWLETLRKLAREESLTSETAPDAPEELGPGLPLEAPAIEPSTGAARPTEAAASDLPAMTDRQFGRRDGPTIER